MKTTRLAVIVAQMEKQTQVIGHRLTVADKIMGRSSNPRIVKKAKKVIQSHLNTMYCVHRELKDMYETDDYSSKRNMKMQKAVRNSLFAGTCSTRYTDALISASLYHTYNPDQMKASVEEIIYATDHYITELENTLGL